MHAHLDRAPAVPSPARTAAPAAETTGRRAARLVAPLALFDGVPPEDVDVAFADAVVVPMPAGTVVFEAGQPAYMLYVVVDGRVRLTVGQGASGRHLATMTRGDTMGLAALQPDDQYPVTAVALDDALLVGLPAASVQHTLRVQPAVAARLIGDVGAKLARFVRELGGQCHRTARARVARMLLDLHRDAPDGAGDLGYDEPKRTIASRLSMTPETLSRELHALAELGLIESRRTRFRVLDAAGLARVADDAAAAPAQA
jgi:CRP-like cAMP-binding protein